MVDTTITLDQFPPASSRLQSGDLLYVYQSQYGEVALPANLLLQYVSQNVTAGLVQTVGAPSSDMGVEGSYAIDMTNGNWYGPKDSSGDWPAAVMPLVAGSLSATLQAGIDTEISEQILANRAQPLIVSALPDASTGVVGQLAIDPTNGVIYGPKTSSGWGTAINITAAALTSTLVTALTTSITSSITNTFAATNGATLIGYDATTVAAELVSIAQQLSALQAGGSNGAPVWLNASQTISASSLGKTIFFYGTAATNPVFTLGEGSSFSSGGEITFINRGVAATTLTVALTDASDFFDFTAYGNGHSTGTTSLTLYFNDTVTLSFTASHEIVVAAGSILWQSSMSLVSDPALGDVSLRPATTNFVNNAKNSIGAISLTGALTYAVTTAQAGMGILAFTGAPGGTATITLPSRAGIYTVGNQTTDASPLLLTNGQTNTVTVAPGKSAYLFSDGATGLYTPSSTSGFQFSGINALSTTAAQALSSSDTGKMVVPNSTVSQTITLPTGSSLQDGASVFFNVLANLAHSVVGHGSDKILLGGTAVTPLALKAYDQFLLTWSSVAGGWDVALYANPISPTYKTLVTTSDATVGGSLTVTSNVTVANGNLVVTKGNATVQGTITAETAITTPGTITTGTGLVFPDGTEQYTANGVTAPTISRFSEALGNLVANTNSIVTAGFIAPFVEVYDGGVYYTRGVDYTLNADGVTINFTNPFITTTELTVLTKVIYSPATTYTPAQYKYTPAAGLSSFPVAPHIAGFQKLYKGGKLVPGIDYTTDGSTITLIGFVTDGTDFQFDVDTPITLANALPMSGGILTGLITTSSQGILLPDNNYLVSVPAGRNRIVNGACLVNHYGTIAVPSGSLLYGGAEQFAAGASSSTSAAFSLTNTALAYGGVSRPAVRAAVTTAATSLTGTNVVYGLYQPIEAYNTYDLAYSPLAVSFLFLSNVTGTFSVALRDGLATPNCYVSTFTATAGVVQKVVVLVPACPTGFGYQSLSGVGLTLFVGALNTGTYQASATNAWATGSSSVGFVSAPNATNWASAVGNYISITDVKLEGGAINTPYGREDVAATLLSCSRYFQSVVQFNGGSSNATAGSSFAYDVPLVGTMRTVPTLTIVSSSVVNMTATFTPTYSFVQITTTVSAAGNFGYAYQLSASAVL